MRICIPTKTDTGREAMIDAHFGRAPFYTIYDTDKRALESVKNLGIHHYGRDRRLLIVNKNVDVVISSGIGHRALERLNECGIKVYRAEATTVSDVIDKFQQDQAEEVKRGDSCVHKGGHHGPRGSHHRHYGEE